jgi:hypothetical protein
MANNLSKKLSNIEVSLNRLRSQKSALQHNLKKHDNKQKKARTRTLIQLGGLFDLTPLLSICGIELGDDLQLECYDKAATLLGMLVNIANQLPENISSEKLSQFKTVGVKLLKQKF